jgi:hypothetical protein
MHVTRSICKVSILCPYTMSLPIKNNHKILQLLTSGTKITLLCESTRWLLLSLLPSRVPSPSLWNLCSSIYEETEEGINCWLSLRHHAQHHMADNNKWSQSFFLSDRRYCSTIHSTLLHTTKCNTRSANLFVSHSQCNWECYSWLNCISLEFNQQQSPQHTPCIEASSMKCSWCLETNIWYICK